LSCAGNSRSGGNAPVEAVGFYRVSVGLWGRRRGTFRNNADLGLAGAFHPSTVADAGHAQAHAERPARGCDRGLACQELAKTGTNTVDTATQIGHADFADLDLLDTMEHYFTLSCSLGVKCLRGHMVKIQLSCCRQSSPTVGALLAAGMPALINGPMQQRITSPCVGRQE
jgi:hypothetical protein